MKFILILLFKGVIYMSYVALYRKYKPKFFKDVLGQNIIVQTLKNAIIHQKVSHCYLFSGNKGTGKTTLARILSKTINCLHSENGDCCGNCSSCNFIEQHNSDIIEIDGASYNGIEEIRDLKSKVNYKANFLKYKIYIIDEVHVLTTNAFNALLKLLEDPPKHVIFVFATTEISKIPETILSRTQNFHFLNIQIKFIIEKLKKIIYLEKISITDDALDKIAFYAQGSMRDALNLLDQVHSYQTNLITVQDIYDIKGVVEEKFLAKLLEYCFNKDLKMAIELIKHINDEGKNLFLFIFDLILMLKNYLLAKIVHQKNLIKNFSVDLAHHFLKILMICKQDLKNNEYKESFVEVIFVQMLSLNFDDYHPSKTKNSLNSFLNQDDSFTNPHMIPFSEPNPHKLSSLTKNLTPSVFIEKDSHKIDDKQKIFNILFNNNEIQKQALKNGWHKLQLYKNPRLQKTALLLFQGDLVAINSNKEILLVYNDDKIRKIIYQKHIKEQILDILNTKSNLVNDYVVILKQEWKKFKPHYEQNMNLKPLPLAMKNLKTDHHSLSSKTLIVTLAEQIFGKAKVKIID